jgi:hypothetical protein
VAAHGADVHPRWWTEPPRATGHGTLRRVVLRTPSLPSALGFFAGILQGDVEHETPTSADLVWPRGARIRLEETADALPGIDRLEVIGLNEERTVIGTRFTPVTE